MAVKDILFIGDPWDTLDHERDSTLHLAAVAAQTYGARSFWALPSEVYFDSQTLYARLEGEVVDGMLHPKNSTRALKEFHSIHWRVDPPVGLSTMRLWSLLASHEFTKPRFLNPPAALLTWNEKFAPLRFGNWAISGLASDSEMAWKAFFKKHSGKKLIAKPSGEAASRGVQILPSSWPQALAALQALRQSSGSWLVLQEFEEKLMTTGETRVFVINGKISGALKKKPAPSHPIMSLDAPANEGPTLSLTTLNAEQTKRAKRIIAALVKCGVYIATIDFIGSKILEINVTSAGLLKWMDERLETKEQLAPKYWAGLIKL